MECFVTEIAYPCIHPHLTSRDAGINRVHQKVLKRHLQENLCNHLIQTSLIPGNIAFSVARNALTLNLRIHIGSAGLFCVEQLTVVRVEKLSRKHFKMYVDLAMTNRDVRLRHFWQV